MEKTIIPARAITTKLGFLSIAVCSNYKLDCKFAIKISKTKLLEIFGL